MSKPRTQEELKPKTVGNNGSHAVNHCSHESNNYLLHRLYLRRLQDFAVPICGFLDNPVDAFDKFTFQRIAALSTENDLKKQMIQSSPLLSQQIATFFSQVLLKTTFQEILKVERAFVYYNKDKNKDEIHAIFGLIVDELEKAASESIEFLPPREEGLSNDSGRKSNAVGQTATATTTRSQSDLRFQFHKALMVNGTAEGLVNFLYKPTGKDRHVWLTEEKDTPLHSAARSRNTKWAKEATEIIVELIDKDPSKWPLKVKELINYQNSEQNTALHLAIENQSLELAQCLLDKGADCLIRNSQGMTPLERMYQKTPEVVLHLLKTAIRPGGQFANDGNLELNIDIRALVGGSSKSMQAANAQENNNNFHIKPSNSKETSNATKVLYNDEGDGKTCIQMEERRALNTTQDTIEQNKTCPRPNLEMDLLAKMVYQNYKCSASIILSHEVVKTFLELKWKKLRLPIYFLTAFYILTYFVFNLFAIWTFIVKFPYAILENNGTSSEESVNVYENLTFWSYLCGVWLEPATGFGAGDAHVDATDRSLAAVLMALGIISWCFELYEFHLIKELTTVTGKCQALHSYFTNLENILQIFFAIGAVAVAIVGMVSEYRLHYWTYWLAAWLVVVSWTLILLQLGNISGWGKYVQIFKTVIQKFTIVMSIYVCFLVGFSTAFSIIFPQERFATFPMSFLRSISMMAGELNYDGIFDPEKVRPFPFVTQALYLGFAVTVTIVLINLLTGLAVDDIGKILKDSDVIHRSIQVERLYVLERMLYKVGFFSDIYVLPLAKRKWDDGSTATVQTRISDLPRELRQELRLAYAEAGKNMIESAFINMR